jgi:hypothetical protein
VKQYGKRPPGAKTMTGVPICYETGGFSIAYIEPVPAIGLAAHLMLYGETGPGRRWRQS